MLIEEAQTQSLDSEYKVFIIDEAHMITTQGFNAFLKTLEEPPAKSIFIMCTTNAEKLPNTILSRVQRYNFQKISNKGIVDRLESILMKEGVNGYDLRAVDYIAKLSEGGMRDAITLLDKCLSYSDELMMDTVVQALNVVDYETMLKLNTALIENKASDVITVVTDVYNSGVDLKYFIKSYFEFILDATVLSLTGDLALVKLPDSIIDELRVYGDYEWHVCNELLRILVELQNSIKYEQNPKSVVIAKMVLFLEELK